MNLRIVQSLPLKEQVHKFHKLFLDRMEAAAYFRDKCIKHDEKLQLQFDARLKEVCRKKMAVNVVLDINVKAVLTWKSKSLKQVDMEQQSISKLNNPKLAGTVIVALYLSIPG